MIKNKKRYLTKEKMSAIQSAPAMVKKRKLAEQFFNSPQYRAHAQRKRLKDKEG